MDSPRRRQTADLTQEIRSRPGSFDFFQAVRLLELEAASTGNGHEYVGTSPSPEKEVIRFRTHPSLAFPPSAIRSVENPPADAQNGGPTGPTEMQVCFMGFVGAAALLPRHYTEHVIKRISLRDTTLRDFLDLFHHRTISLFYRAWRKYHFAFAYEHAVRTRASEDTFTRALFSLTGLGLDTLRHRQPVDDAAFVFQAGHFSRVQRPAQCLEGLLESLLRVPFRVEQFVGHWVELDSAQRSRLPSRGDAPTDRQRLGRGVCLGSRTWDVQSKVRLIAGPLTYSELQYFLPGTKGQERVRAITSSFLAGVIEFDLQCVLATGESPGIRLGGDHPVGLGHDTWLENHIPSTAQRRATFPLTKSNP